jgi:NAD(P)H-hydrate epimerase
MKVVTSAEMRRAEERAEAAGVSTGELMARAGLAVAEAVRSELSGAAGRRVLILTGPGNNGGDGLVAAQRLARWGAEVSVYLPVRRQEPDPLLEACFAAGCEVRSRDEDPDGAWLASHVRRAEAVVDAILGTGRARPLEGALARTLARVREEKTRRPSLRTVAVDLPTGLNADTGELDPQTLSADMTLVLGLPKRGHLALPGAEACGRMVLVDIGLPPDADRDASLGLIDAASTRVALPERPLGGHKGTFGRALIVGGSQNYIGAPALAARAAARAGAGLVTIAAPASLTPSISALCPEATHNPLPDEGHLGFLGGRLAADELLELPHYDGTTIGPGLGHTSTTALFLKRALYDGGESAELGPLVLDADALNILATMPSWWARLPQPAVLTPHPGEMGRLTGLSPAQVQADRLGLAQARAQEWGVVLVLKGAFTIVASPEGRTAISPIALPALATAGTGDVLSGALAGLLAQGMEVFPAACAAVYVHGLAGALAAQETGDGLRGIVASDVAEKLPTAIAMVRRGERTPLLA